MRCAIYARVSDDKKKSDGTRRQDINRQVERIERYLKAAKIKEYVVYSDDGKSAFTEDLNQRPAFKQLLLDVRYYKYDHIYVESLDRFSRKLQLGLVWLRLLSKHNCNLISLSEGEVDVTSSEGWMRSAMFLMMAEWYSRQLSEKVKSGMAKAKERGKHVGRPKKRSAPQPTDEIV